MALQGAIPWRERLVRQRYQFAWNQSHVYLLDEQGRIEGFGSFYCGMV